VVQSSPARAADQLFWMSLLGGCRCLSRQSRSARTRFLAKGGLPCRIRPFAGCEILVV
jgi:hypothetical protein